MTPQAPITGDEVGKIADAPRDGTQIIVPVGPGLFDVVSWWDGGWRETTNGMRLRNEPSVFMPIPTALRSAATAARQQGVGK